MHHNSKSDKFIFNLPSDFIPKEFETKYMDRLEDMKKPYNTVLDYINSTILDINMPGIVFPSVKQTKIYGKERYFRGGTSPYDSYTRELNITMKNVDFYTSYMIVHDAMLNHYIKNGKPYVDDFTIILINDEDRELFRIVFKELLPISQSDFRLGYQIKDENTETYTLNFKFNRVDIEYVPKIDDMTADGEIIEEYYDRLIINDMVNDPTKTYPNNTGCDDDIDNNFDENHPIIKKPD